MSISSLTAIGTPSSGRSLSRAHARVRLCRLQQRPLCVDRGEGVQLGIEALDPAERQLDELLRRRLAAPDQLGLAGHARERDVVVEHPVDPTAWLGRRPSSASSTMPAPLEHLRQRHAAPARSR